MHPFSVFPQLFFLGLLAPFLLRIVAGAYLATLGLNRYKKLCKWSSVVYGISALFLILGLYTQIVAIAGILVLTFDYYDDKKHHTVSKEKIVLYVIVGVIFLSLLFTGPGFLALDLPL